MLLDMSASEQQISPNPHYSDTLSDSKVRGAYMGPTWGPMNLAIWELFK